ncbi:MAG: cytochrome P450, partial [Acidimicrobiales bacterium]
MGPTADPTAAVSDGAWFNPYAHEVHDDPFPFYRRLRDEAPAYHNPDLGFYALSRHHDVLEALHDYDTFCNRHGITLEEKNPLPMMLTMDPPDHTVMRRVVSRVFTPRRIAELEPHIRELSAKHLDAIDDPRSFDLIGDYSGRLPMDVISTMLGVPDEDQQMLRAWSDALIERDEGS